jgi:hypothetical protein
MRYLFKGMESRDQVEILIALTQIKSANVKSALIDYFVSGYPESIAASANSVQLSNLSAAIKRLNEVRTLIEKFNNSGKK